MKRALITGLAVFAMCLSYASQAQTQARITQSIDNSLVLIPHSVHPLARQANDRSRVGASLPMERILLVLKPSADQQAALQKKIDGLHNPDSTNYHQWMGPEEFGVKFGAADEDLAKVTGWLQQQGFRVDTVGRGKQYIEFSGTAGQVENAFHTEMHHYVVNGKEYVANALDVSIPVALTPVVQGVLSLHNFPKTAVHGKSFRVHRDPNSGKLVPDFTLSNANGSAHFLAPGDFSRIYNTAPLLSQKINGTGVSIAIVARSNINLSDVQIFRKIFGLPAKDPVFIINGQDPGLGADEDEADLDVQWSGATAPDATIKVVVSSSTLSTDGVDLSMVYIIDNDVAPIMSTSFSACELALGPTGNAFFNNLYEQAAAEGITAFASTGDDGPAACTPQVDIGPSTIPNVSGLASTPFDIAVGGTQFAENGLDGNYWDANDRADQSSALGYIPETVWNESCDPRIDPNQCFGSGLFFAVAGSGGPSSCLTSAIVNNQFVCQGGYRKPPWQAGRGVPDDGVRDLPDLSFDAGSSHDGFLLCVEGSCRTVESGGQTILENATVIGGTSASAPSMAGVMALIEQKHGISQGLANFNFYKLASQDALADCNSSRLTDPTQPSNCSFQDVTAGSNAVPGLAGYHAKKGYDMSTGLGTLNVEKIVKDWPTAKKLASVTQLSSGSISARHGQPVPIDVLVKAKSGTGAPSGDLDLITDKFGSVLAGTLLGGGFSGNVAGLPGGHYAARVRYSGDAMFAASDSASTAVSITPEDPLVNVDAWEINLGGFPVNVFGPLLYGQPTGFDIRVAGASGVGAATGTVTVKDGMRPLGTFPLAQGGVAFVQVDGLPSATGMEVGKHSFTVVYNGDNSFKAATSAPIRLDVIKKTPITLITPIPSTVTAGAPMELSLLVGAAGLALPAGVDLPSGSVQVFADDKPISAQIPVVFHGPEGTGAAQAVFTATFSTPGVHNLALHYSGDSNYSPVRSIPFMEPASITVNASKGSIPGIAVKRSPSTIVLGQSVNYVVTVKSSTSAHIPTGEVSIVSGNDRVLAGPVTLTSGNASLVLTFAGTGTFPVTARYSGDKNYSPFSSAIVTSQVNQGTPAVTLTAASGTVAANAQTSFTVRVVGAPTNPILGAAGTPVGAVQFFDSVNGAAARPMGSQESLTTDNSGNSIFTLPAILPAGMNVITVKYLGDANWAPATSKPVTAIVQ
jgi:hypothetical protein